MPRSAPERDGGEPVRSLAELDLDAHLADPAIRQRFVTTMFDVIAPRYDRFTRVFSFGMDAGWKRELLRWLRDIASSAATVRGSTEPREVAAPHDRGERVEGAGGSVARVLDLACGTGDLALSAAHVLPRAEVIGLDASPRMIREALARRAGSGPGASRVRFAVGDMMALPERDASVDIVTVGYGLRNVPDPAGALAEIARVLRPGGRVLVLDFYLPASRLWRSLFVWYLRVSGNLVGWLWHREPVVYGYIAASLERWVTAARFRDMLGEQGLAPEREMRKLGGGIALHMARKRGPADSR